MRDDKTPQFWQHHLESARASGDHELEGVALTNLGSIYSSLGEDSIFKNAIPARKFNF